MVPTTHCAAVPFPYRYASRSQGHMFALQGTDPLQLEMLDKAMHVQFAWVLEALLRASSQLTDRNRCWCGENPNDWKCEHAEMTELCRTSVGMKLGNLAGARTAALFLPACPTAALAYKLFPLTRFPSALCLKENWLYCQSAALHTFQTVSYNNQYFTTILISQRTLTRKSEEGLLA